jgi:plastocyanin
MNKNVILVIIAVLIIGGIVAFASMNRTAAPTDNTAAAPLTTNDSNPDTNADLENVATSSTDTINVGVSTGSEKVFTVNGNNFKFDLATINVKKGDTVRIIFKNTGGTHDLVIDEFNVATAKIGNGAQDEISFVADKAGSFEYYCSVGNHRNMGMKGTLVVSE